MSPAVLFDVDGTLVKGQGAGKTALAQGLEQVLGVAGDRALEITERIDYRGSTDQRILQQIFDMLGLDGSERKEALLEAYVGHLPASIESSRMELLPGTRELLGELERLGVRVGLLTGNIRAAARLKVQPFGLGALADAAGGFGDDGRNRDDIARVALRRLSEQASPAPVVVVGDTEWDVAAARAIGAFAVAVETGWTPREQLLAAGPDLLLPDLRQREQLLGLVAAGGPRVNEE